MVKLFRNKWGARHFKVLPPHKRGFNDTMKINRFSSIIKSKKGFNDISIITIIIFIFFTTAIIIPFVNAEFDANFSTLNTDTVSSNVQADAKKTVVETSPFDTSAFDVIKNILNLAFFDTGESLGLPFWLDLVYTVLAIILILTIARNIWIGGGG